MKSIKIHLIAGARPNFMKIAPLYHELKKRAWAETKIVHTDQHYDENMSGVFFRDLGLPRPDFSLGAGSGSHGEQTGKVMIEYEKVAKTDQPNLVIVVGDVNSTIAATLVAVKMGIKAAHLEAGLRSRDRSMPEEINRLATDAICDALWTPSADGDDNLRQEGVPSEKITLVGNIMIDSFEMQRQAIQADTTREKLGLQPQEYAVITLHRPSNVDDPKKLSALVSLLLDLQTKIHLVLPLHPRTRKNLQSCNLLSALETAKQISLVEPLPYVQFMGLLLNCRFTVTDSGGVQEETTYLGIPCLTMRDNTERPITVTQGTNRLVNLDTIGKFLDPLMRGEKLSYTVPRFWDGRTAARVADDIERRWLGD